jgi:HPt (histidine-containing phosphotransfer) domain-containing protein
VISWVERQIGFHTRPSKLDRRSDLNSLPERKGNIEMSPSNHSNPADATPPVDFMALLARCLGNFKMVERVMAAFRDSAKSDFSLLQGAIEHGDFAAVVDISHRFKGTASNVSATGLVKHLIRAEASGREKDQPELTRILAALQLEMEALMRFAEAFAPTTTKPGPAAQVQDSSEARHACAGS